MPKSAQESDEIEMMKHFISLSLSSRGFGGIFWCKRARKLNFLIARISLFVVNVFRGRRERESERQADTSKSPYAYIFKCSLVSFSDAELYESDMTPPSTLSI
jgi:hypothetical protein